MAEREIPLRLHIAASLAVVAPAAVGLGLYLLLRDIGWAAAWIAGLAALLVAAVVARLYLRDFSRFGSFVDALANDLEPAEPRFSVAPAADALSRAAITLTAGWRRNQAAIEGLEASARAIIDGLPDPLVAIDRQRRLTRANRAATLLLGEVPLGRDLSACLRQPSLLDATDAVLAAETIDEGAESVDLQFPGPPVQDFVGHVRRLPVAAVDGSLVLIVLHDVTTQRAAERTRADFVANASHELKTPLATLLGFIETLRGPARDDAAAQVRFLGIMAEQAERMRRLVGDLLALSQIEQREHSRPRGAVKLSGVLRELRDMLDLRARERRVQLVLELPSELRPVEGDRDEIMTVFQNLMDNAVKFTRSASRVRIIATNDNALEMARVEVIDQGEGIPEGHIPRLTERFYRVDSARSRDLGGTGLGLAIVKHLVNRHRGRLSIRSVVGEGSSFTVLLPWHQATAEDSAEPLPRAARMPSAAG